jgi:hypothetical protein
LRPTPHSAAISRAAECGVGRNRVYKLALALAEAAEK